MGVNQKRLYGVEEGSLEGAEMKGVVDLLLLLFCLVFTYLWVCLAHAVTLIFVVLN